MAVGAEGEFGTGNSIAIGGTRADAYGGEVALLSWIKSKMTAPIRVLEENAQHIADVGVQAVQDQIEGQDRIDTRAMLEGVQSEVTSSRTANSVNIKVGWDLSQFRDGYPELQDDGFQLKNGTMVQGMHALDYAKLAMELETKRMLGKL